MANTSKKRSRSFDCLMSGVSTLLVSWLTVYPVQAHEPCQDSLKNSSPNLKMGCLRHSLREAIAQAKLTGKPLLTERNLNELIPEDAEDSWVLNLILAFTDRRSAFLKLLTPVEIAGVFCCQPKDAHFLQALTRNHRRVGRTP